MSELRFVPTQEIVWRDIVVDISGRNMESVISELRSEVSEGDIVRITFAGSGELDGMMRLHAEENRGYLSKVLGCIVCEIVAETSPAIDMEARSAGSDMTAKVISAGRELAGSGRDAILAVILANPIAARHRDYYEGLSDEQLSALAERAAGMLVASMEGAR